MIISSTTRSFALSMSAVLFLCAAPWVAHTEGDDVSEVAEQVGKAVEAVSDEQHSSGADGVEVTLSPDPLEGVQTFSDEGSLQISLPQEAELAVGERAADGSMVYLGDGDSPSVSAQEVPGGVRIATVIEEGQATELTYPMEGLVPTLAPDGSVSLSEVESVSTEAGPVVIETQVARIDMPWAVDAAGNVLPTHFEVEGNLVTQVVDTSSATRYPIVADPKIVWIGPVVAVLWNRVETKTLANFGVAAGVVTAVCIAAVSKGGPAAIAAAGAVCAGVTLSVVYHAGIAENSRPKKCVRLNVVNPHNIPQVSVGTYGPGGTCK